MTILYKTDLDKYQELSVSFTDDTCKISDGIKTISIHAYHQNDCCEHVYADFSIISFYQEELEEMKTSGLYIKAVKDMGFLLCFRRPGLSDIKIFIPCYNEQNGYYSDDLELQIEDSGVMTKIDISECVEDIIC